MPFNITRLITLVGGMLPVLLVNRALPQSPVFTDQTLAAGLTWSFQGEGVCILDYDGDGWEDVFIADHQGEHLLLKNLGNLQFSESSETAGIGTTEPLRLATAGDYDNDGYTDLFLGATGGSSRLYHNEGNGTFTDATIPAGITVDGDVRGGFWFDENRDGWLDLYVGRLTQQNLLYRNNQDGTFMEVASQVNATGPQSGGLVMGCSALDYDNDGDEDIFITQDGYKGNILLRREAYGAYTDMSNAAGVHLAVQGMGVAVGDYDRDGWDDIYTTNLDENSLLRNNGDGTFTDVTAAAGVADAVNSMAWGTFFFDADFDGCLDIYNNNQSGFGQVPNSLFRNLGNGSFEEISAVAGVQSWNDGIGSAWCDFDRDGDLDMILVGTPTTEGSLKLYRNETVTGNWIAVRLEGVTSNLSGIGATIRLRVGSHIQRQHRVTGTGYCSQNSEWSWFGLDTATIVDTLEILWPSGIAERYWNLSINQYYLFTENGGWTPLTTESEISPTTFTILPVYPNPFNGHFTVPVMVRSEGEISVAVRNITGRQVWSRQVGSLTPGRHEIHFSLSNVSSGQYLLEVGSLGTRQVQKILLLK